MNDTTINIAGYSFLYDEANGILAKHNGKVVSADVQKISDNEFSVLVEGKSFHILLSQSGNSFSATVNNFIFDIQRETQRDKLTKKLQKESDGKNNSVTVKAPMPGLVTKILTAEQTHVNVGEGILIVEAMKMENEIKSPKTGILKKIFIKEKQAVEKNDNLFTIE